MSDDVSASRFVASHPLPSLVHRTHPPTTRGVTYQSGSESCIGKRKTNEDALVAIDDYGGELQPPCTDLLAFYGVYDGHGGSYVASNCAKYVHKMLLEHPAFPYDARLAFYDVFQRADRVVTAPADRSGSTALCCAVLGTTLYVANLGDSECVLGTCNGSKKGGKGRYTGTVLTRKHNPTTAEEKRRIAQLGGSVVFGRLFGTLAVSRGLGDMAYKQAGKEYVSVVPHVTVRALDRTARFLVLACDGLWDTVTYDAAARRVGEMLDAGAGPDAAAHALCEMTLARGSQDNVSVVVVYFHWSRR